MLNWDDFLATRGGVRAEKLAAGLWRLTETALVEDCRSCFYLLETSDVWLLVDGGWGLTRDLRDLPMIDHRPLVSIATHSHSDHIGALHLADIRYGHAAEAEVFADPEPYATQARPWIDDLVFAADGSEIDASSYHQRPCALTHPVCEGDELQFGDICLHVLFTPGHSPGSICLLEPDKGWLFCADTVHDGHIYDDIPGADAAALALSHSRLLGVDFQSALPGHGELLSKAAFADRIARYRREKDEQA